MRMLRALGRPLLERLSEAIAGRLNRRLNTEADEVMRVMLGQLCARQMLEGKKPARLAEAEFRVFSQWGEDGIIQYLIHAATVAHRSFVEFGVEDYLESNTRFLLLKDNWQGLVFDSSAACIDAIRRDRIYWRHDLRAECAFITRENIDELISRRLPGPELGLLSIDIDGNDYWVWQAIRSVRPSIVVCEYNSVFGARLAVTIPYRPDFDRTAAHHSNLYFGASLPALCRLAAEKGYAFVGSNSAGNNAFFVRRDSLGAVRPVSVEEGYVESRFRESRDASGRLSYLRGRERLRAIKDMPLVDIESGATRSIAELYAAELA